MSHHRLHWQQQPSTTMATTSGNGHLEPHRRLCNLHQCLCLIGETTPCKRVLFLWGLRWSVALKMLRCCGDASSLEQRSMLRAIDPLKPPKHICLLGGMSPINPMHQCLKFCLLWGAREYFHSMAVTVWLVVVYGCLPRLC